MMGRSSSKTDIPTPNLVGLRFLSVLGAAVALVWAPAALADTTSSSNWAGYAVHGPKLSFRSVQALWRQPAVSCIPGAPTYSSYWVGLGGYSVKSPALEQIGTEVDCTRSGRVSSTAWYELVPAPSARANLAVAPGDTMFGSVSVKGRKVTVTLDDLTSKRSFSKTLTASVLDVSSADWIVEAPSECLGVDECQALTLADFGSATFSNALAQASTGATGTISDPAWQSTKIKLMPNGQHFVGYIGSAAPLGGATPSVLATNGSSFKVSYSQLSTPGTPVEARRSFAPLAGRLVHSGR